MKRFPVNGNGLPATSNDVCANRSLAVHLLQSVIVNRLSSNPFRVYLLMNLNVMKVPMCSVSMAVIEKRHQVIVAIPKLRERKTNVNEWRPLNYFWHL